jgi:hypothetical protein
MMPPPMGGSGPGSVNGLVCVPEDPCLEKKPGDACKTGEGTAGTCTKNEFTEELECLGDPLVHGQLSALNVDACGFVYVAEDGVKVWRVAPDGKQVEAVTELTDAPLSSAQWGTKSGVWEPTSLYFIERDQPRAYGIRIGTPGAGYSGKAP